MARPLFRFLIPLGVLTLAVSVPAAAASAATSGTWTVTGSMNAARFMDASTVLPDGEVLAAGSGTLAASAELYNPATGTWSPTGNMTTSRQDQTATLLLGGKVLVTGGLSSSDNALSSAELYNPATGTWSPTGSMASPRAGQRATLLPGGNVLVSAGIEAAAGSFAELYNPAAGTWSAATGGLNSCLANMDCRLGSSATLLGNGQVLVAGGLIGLDSNPSSTASAILYNPATNSWTATGSLTTAREDQTANLLTSGQVLAAGRRALRQPQVHRAVQRRTVHPVAATRSYGNQSVAAITTAETGWSGIRSSDRASRQPRPAVSGVTRRSEDAAGHHEQCRRGDVIVTDNLSDFPPAALPAPLARQSMDDFLLDTLNLHPAQVISTLRTVAGRTGRSGSPMTARDIAAYLQAHSTPPNNPICAAAPTFAR